MTESTGSAIETNRKPLAPEEIADRLIPEDPQISPDRGCVAFTVRAASKKSEHDECSIWLSRNGKAARQFTAGATNDRSPRWSPDGMQLAFVSDRKPRKKESDETRQQLYLIPIDGGEARQLGEIEGDLSAPAWSQDGRSIALLREDPESAEKKKKTEDRDDAILADSDTKRRRLWVVDTETGKARQLTYGSRQIWEFSWKPDSELLTYTTTDGYDLNATCGPGDVWTIPVAGGLPKHIARFPTLPGTPVIIDAGIAVTADAAWVDPVSSVWLAPIEGGEPRNLLPGYAGQVEAIYPIAGDPYRVALRMVEGTHGLAYAFDVESCVLTPVGPAGQHGSGSVIAGPSLCADGSHVALVWADGDRPQEVYATEILGEPNAVTSLGKPFAGRLNPAETVSWQSDGWVIEGILTYPTGYEEGKRYPLIVEIHGGPSWQWEDYCYLDWHDWAQLMASHGFAVLAPNPRGSTGRGTDFQRQLQNDVGGGEVRDLITGALAMVERGIADGDRLGIGGWSWGGYLTATTITRTDLFKAAMMGAGLANLISDHGTDDIWDANLHYFTHPPYEDFDPYWTGSAMSQIKNCKTPTLILHGDADARVTPSQGAEMYRALKTLGVPTEFVRYPREGHPIVERHHQLDLMRRLVAWYTKWLKDS